ncbi:very short patch repair endonuclease [Paremcibacter congregatus]|uniref:very short patch repair endonuclease n=1 Tax=Paremcibacter congregatus TaxID=2043170 RepID=UPI0030ED0F70
MPDIVTSEKRSQMMAGIKGKNTKPEMLVRKLVHSLGYRYRLHVNDLPGKPDLVFPRHRGVIFVHGCFWHGHNCHLFKLPGTRQEFWKTKIEKNRMNDSKAKAALQNLGWRQLDIWECALKGKTKVSIDNVGGFISKWLCSDEQYNQLVGNAGEK